MSTIFISYRRQDSAAYAGRICDRLVAQFGVEKVFMDVDSIHPGADFVAVLNEKLGGCAVMLVVIGRSWLSVKDDDGQPRLNDPRDFVRMEVAFGLKKNIAVIPVLVNAAMMPGGEDLPADLRDLARRQAFVISDVHFHANVSQLIEKIIPMIEPPEAALVNLSGEWIATVDASTDTAFKIAITLDVLDNQVFGMVRYPTGQGGIIDGRIDGDRITFRTEHTPQFEKERAIIHFQGQIAGDEITFFMQSDDSFRRFCDAKKHNPGKRFSRYISH